MMVYYALIQQNECKLCLFELIFIKFFSSLILKSEDLLLLPSREPKIVYSSVLKWKISMTKNWKNFQ